MPINSAQVGLKDLYYAKCTKDDATGVTYDTPTRLAPAISAKITPSVSTEVLYADDGALETTVAFGEIAVELENSDLPLEIQADLLGHTLAGGVMVSNTSDTAPYVALGFRSKKSNGKYRYIWLLKGKFSEVEDEYKTQEDKVSYNTPKIKASFVKRTYDDNWKYTADEDSSFTGGATWFSAVYNPTGDTTPPTVTVSPNDDATGVATTSNIVWTFSEAILESCVTSANFMLMQNGANVAGALSIDETKTIVTFNPTVDLTAATAYTAVCTTNVKDTSNNALAANSITNFTTA